MIKLRDAVKGTAKVRYTQRPTLWAQQCAGCGRIFKMIGMKLEGPTRVPGSMRGLFDQCAEDRDGRGLGNMFNCSVCSLACAQIVQDGAWTTIKEYKPYAKIGAKLERVEVYVTNTLLNETEIIAQWEQATPRPAPTEQGEGIIYASGSFSIGN